MLAEDRTGDSWILYLMLYLLSYWSRCYRIFLESVIHVVFFHEDVIDINVILNIIYIDTVGNSTESTTVDGINLDEIKEFAKQFKIRRLSLGLTQTQVGQALSATEGPAYSQSAICR